MNRQPDSGRHGSVRSSSANERVVTFAPSIDTRDVFRQMIAMELRSGRLTRAHRRRIIRYAARMGLGAVEAGQLITACRNQALRSDDSVERGHALRLVQPRPERIPVPVMFSVALVLAILINLVVVAWLWH